MWHKRMRQELGIAGKDGPTHKALFQAHYQGARYAFGYPACPDLEEQANRYLWPVFVSNIAADILVANKRFFRVIGRELEQLFREDPTRRNLMSVASDPRFAKRVRN